MGDSVLQIPPETAPTVRDEAAALGKSVRSHALIEFVALMGLGIAGWFLCAPVLPIPSNAHPRAFLIALVEMLFLVGVGCRAARLPRFAPTALRRRLERREPS